MNSFLDYLLLIIVIIMTAVVLFVTYHEIRYKLYKKKAEKNNTKHE